MGLFRSSGSAAAATKDETQKILINKKKSSGSIDLKASSSWDDSDDNGVVVAGGGDHRHSKTSKPKFWRLHEELVGGENQHKLAIHHHLQDLQPVPLPASSASTREPPQRVKKTPRKTQMFQKLESVDELLAASNNTPSKIDQIKKTAKKLRSSQKKKRANMPLHALPSMDEPSECQVGNSGTTTTSTNSPQRPRIKTSTSVDSATASIAEYQPPPAFLAAAQHHHIPSESEVSQMNLRPMAAAKSATIVTMPRDKKSSRQFQSFMHDNIAATFSDDTLDNDGDGINIGTIQPSSTTDTPSGLYSESGFPTSQGGHKFQQFVFDRQFNQIENVKVAKSDPGASDFSDFIQAAAKLSKKLAPAVVPERSGNEAAVKSKSATTIKRKPTASTAAAAPKATAWPNWTRLESVAIHRATVPATSDARFRETPAPTEVTEHAAAAPMVEVGSVPAIHFDPNLPLHRACKRQGVVVR